MSREQVNGWNDAIGQAAIVLELETIFERTHAAIELILLKKQKSIFRQVKLKLFGMEENYFLY